MTILNARASSLARKLLGFYSLYVIKAMKTTSMFSRSYTLSMLKFRKARKLLISRILIMKLEWERHLVSWDFTTSLQLATWIHSYNSSSWFQILGKVFLLQMLTTKTSRTMFFTNLSLFLLTFKSQKSNITFQKASLMHLSSMVNQSMSEFSKIHLSFSTSCAITSRIRLRILLMPIFSDKQLVELSETKLRVLKVNTLIWVKVRKISSQYH